MCVCVYHDVSVRRTTHFLAAAVVPSPWGGALWWWQFSVRLSYSRSICERIARRGRGGGKDVAAVAGLTTMAHRPPPFVRIAGVLLNMYLFFLWGLRPGLTLFIFLPSLLVPDGGRPPPRDSMDPCPLFLEIPRACSLPAGAVSDSWCRRSLGWQCAGETHGHDHACANELRNALRIQQLWTHTRSCQRRADSGENEVALWPQTNGSVPPIAAHAGKPPWSRPHDARMRALRARCQRWLAWWNASRQNIQRSKERE